MKRTAKQSVAPVREAAILQAIRLDLGSEPDLVVLRNDNGAFRSESGQWVKYGLGEGTSDLVCMLRMSVLFIVDSSGGARGGEVRDFARWFVLEVKSPMGRTSKRRRETQRLFLELVRRMGGFGAQVDSVEAARAALDRARQGASE